MSIRILSRIASSSLRCSPHPSAFTRRRRSRSCSPPTGSRRRSTAGSTRRSPKARMEVRPRRADPHGRPAGQRAAAAGGRPARRRDGGRAAGDVGDRAGRAGRRDRRDIPEESDGDHRASRAPIASRTSRASRSRSAPQPTRRSGRGCDRNTDSPTARSVRTGFPCSRFSPTPSCRSRDSRHPSRSRSRKAACGRSVFLLADFGYPPYSEALVVTRTTLAAPHRNARAIPPRVRGRLDAAILPIPRPATRSSSKRTRR